MNDDRETETKGLPPGPAVFLHLSSWRLDASHLGKVFATPKDNSNYWAGKLRIDWAREAAKSVPLVNAPLPDAVATKLVDALCMMKYATELLKEYVFEEVRSAEFPRLPSRRRCMFLFADCHSPSVYARLLGWPEGRHSVVRVRPRPQSVLHVADMRHLNCNTRDHEGLVSAARQYWSPADPLDINSEVLLEGEWELVEFTPPGMAMDTSHIPERCQGAAGRASG